jgi:cytochrome c oxidase subunit 1
MGVASARSLSPAAAQPRRLRLNVLTGLIGGLIGFFVGMRIGVAMGFGQNDNAPLCLGYGLAIAGYLIGLGFFNPIARWMLGMPQVSADTRAYLYGARGGVERYFRLTLDHKVIGVQYLGLILAMFCFGGFSALLIRVELLSPNMPVFPPDTYLTIVGLHSTTMVFMGTSAIVGPIGNYFVPLMIGSKRMAVPWLEALSLWLLLLAFAILASTLAFGGFPTGWTGYAPLADEAHRGMDSYLVAFMLTGAGLVVSAINMLITVLRMRAPGMTWSRLPIFVWSVIVASILGWLAAPIIMATDTMVSFDRIFNTGFFVPQQGGTPYLYENLFWTFGHPEVYIFAVPAFGIVLELLPVFSRKPLFSYYAAVLGMFGIGLMSWFVWQHHLFVSGLTPALRPFFMFSTEMISFPTGIVFLNALGTLYKGRIRLTVPMMFSLAFFFNFLLGGFSGVFLSDVPTDVQLHGSYAVQAHFHFVLMGGVLFALFAACYYWFPKLTGRRMNDKLGMLHFWWTWIGFNGTFITLLIVGLAGMPRRVVSYLPDLQNMNIIASVFAFILGASMFVFLYNLIYSWGWGTVSEENPWEARTLEWLVPTPIPTDNFEEVPLVVSGPYDYGLAQSSPMAILNPSRQAARAALQGDGPGAR